jgi:hypothetical protein
MHRRDCLAILTAAAVLLAGVSAAEGAPPRSMRFHKQVVMDKQGFNMEAFRLLVPDQWRFQGGVTWNTRKYPAEPFVAFTVKSPDGQSLLEHFPHHTCFWSQDPNLQASYAQGGADILQPMGGVDYLRNVFLRRHRKDISDLKVLESGPLPELAKRNLEINRHLMNVFNQISPFTFRYDLNADAGHLRVQYRRQGRTVVEEMIVSTSVMTAYFQGMYGMVTAITWIPQVKSFQAPAQEMGARAHLFKVMVDTYQENPAWGVACTRLAADITRNQLRQQQAIFSRMNEIRRTQSQVSDMIAEGYQRRSAAQDRVFDKYSEGIRGVDTYRDPVNDREIELPTGMSNAWTNGNEYIFSDQAGYNPNIGSNLNWQQMERRD